jgi:hypothetical protein
MSSERWLQCCHAGWALRNERPSKVRVAAIGTATADAAQPGDAAPLNRLSSGAF